MKAESYLKDTEKQISRLLSSMDRNRGCDTFGCLSRPYWHDKVTDFPSAHQQIGVFPLTLALTQEWKDNPFYQSEEISDYVEAALNYWAKIQKRNGSFDEHYPNEHSVGAVAWTLWAVTESYLLLEDPPGIEQNIERAVEFLEKEDEPGDIANHQAVAASALVNAHEIIGKGKEQAREKLEMLEEMQADEGWFQEYVGADIGYQSTTISHLGRVRDREPDIVDDRMVEKALDFFSNFIDERNYYAGIIGSRNTEHIHAAGFELLAEDFDKAEKIAAAIRENRSEGRLIETAVMDDKHFSRQLAEYLDAYRHRSENIEEEFTEILEEDHGPIEIIAGDDRKIFLNKSKGGVYRAYNEGKLVEQDRGIATEVDGDVYTSNWPGVVEEVNREGERYVFEGKLREVPRNSMPGRYFIASRLFNYTLGRFPRLSLAAKDVLISLLIGSDTGRFEFERELNLVSGEVEDEFPGNRITGKVHSNFVPSSEFFSGEELEIEDYETR